MIFTQPSASESEDGMQEYRISSKIKYGIRNFQKSVENFKKLQKLSIFFTEIQKLQKSHLELS
jgi:hypothetical protein